jgi:hypothetical protein
MPTTAITFKNWLSSHTNEYALIIFCPKLNQRRSAKSNTKETEAENRLLLQYQSLGLFNNDFQFLHGNVTAKYNGKECDL